jgi:hypothetical protein
LVWAIREWRIGTASEATTDGGDSRAAPPPAGRRIHQSFFFRWHLGKSDGVMGEVQGLKDLFRKISIAVKEKTSLGK